VRAVKFSSQNILSLGNAAPGEVTWWRSDSGAKKMSLEVRGISPPSVRRLSGAGMPLPWGIQKKKKERVFCKKGPCLEGVIGRTCRLGRHSDMTVGGNLLWERSKSALRPRQRKPQGGGLFEIAHKGNSEGSRVSWEIRNSTFIADTGGKWTPIAKKVHFAFCRRKRVLN